MKTIWKYDLKQYINPSFGVVTQFPVIEMPMGAHPLTVQMQDGDPKLWAVVRDDVAKVPRKFVVVGTGTEIPSGTILRDYIGTWQEEGEMFSLVFHLFEFEED